MLPHCVSGFYTSLTCARLQWCHPPPRKAHTAAPRGLCGVTAALRFDLERAALASEFERYFGISAGKGKGNTFSVRRIHSNSLGKC